MTIEERVRMLHDRAVSDLIEAHKKRQDEPLVLAVRYDLDESEDVRLLEALQGFPGGDDDELLVTEFEPGPQLRILGKLRLALGSPAQIAAAATRGDAIIEQVKRGRVLYTDGSPRARRLKKVLGL